METDSSIYVAGHRGLVGSAIVRKLTENGFTNLVTASRSEVDLTDHEAVNDFFSTNRPDYVFLAAARVGGIVANMSAPVPFLEDNLTIQTNVIGAAHRSGARKLMFLGSSCIYPRDCPQPIKEEYLLTGPLESTNQWYAIAKIAGLKLVRAYRQQYGSDFVSVMPCNLYGPGDNFDLESSHVIPGMMRRLDEAKRSSAPSITLWGTGRPRREFLYIDDLADACVNLMQNWSENDFINIGTGTDCTIRELSAMLTEVVDYEGEVQFDATHPDGTPRKVLDVSRLHAAGWQHSVSLMDGLRKTYSWFCDNRSNFS